MKQSLKSKRSRKGRKSSQEPSSSRTHESEVQTESPPPLRLVRRKSPRIKRKRTPEPERDAIPSPPKAKKRKKRNLSSSGSNLSSSESGSSQGEAPSHLQEVRLVNDDITKSSSFAKYLKVIFIHLVYFLFQTVSNIFLILRMFEVEPFKVSGKISTTTKNQKHVDIKMCPLGCSKESRNCKNCFTMVFLPVISNVVHAHPMVIYI